MATTPKESTLLQSRQTVVEKTRYGSTFTGKRGRTRERY